MSNENTMTRKTRKPNLQTIIQKELFENASAFLKALSNPVEAFKVDNKIVAINLGKFNTLRVPTHNYTHTVIFRTNKSEHGVDYTFQCGGCTNQVIAKGTFPMETAQESIDQVHNAIKMFDVIWDAAQKI